MTYLVINPNQADKVRQWAAEAGVRLEFTEVRLFRCTCNQIALHGIRGHGVIWSSPADELRRKSDFRDWIVKTTPHMIGEYQDFSDYTREWTNTLPVADAF